MNHFNVKCNGLPSFTGSAEGSGGSTGLMNHFNVKCNRLPSFTVSAEG